MPTIEFFRSFKLGEYAIFDLAISFLGIWLLSPLLSKIFRLFRLDIPTSSWIFLTLPLSITIHALIAKYTPMTKYFLDPSGHYALKLFIFSLLVIGIHKIKIIKK